MLSIHGVAGALFYLCNLKLKTDCALSDLQVFERVWCVSFISFVFISFKFYCFEFLIMFRLFIGLLLVNLLFIKNTKCDNNDGIRRIRRMTELSLNSGARGNGDKKIRRLTHETNYEFGIYSSDLGSHISSDGWELINIDDLNNNGYLFNSFIESYNHNRGLIAIKDFIPVKCSFAGNDWNAPYYNKLTINGLIGEPADPVTFETLCLSRGVSGPQVYKKDVSYPFKVPGEPSFIELNDNTVFGRTNELGNYAQIGIFYRELNSHTQCIERCESNNCINPNDNPFCINQQSWGCTTCQNGYFKPSNNHPCVSCNIIDNCNSCNQYSSSGCISCNSGYRKKWKNFNECGYGYNVCELI